MNTNEQPPINQVTKTEAANRQKEAITQYQEWIKSAGGHSKLGKFYRRTIESRSHLLDVAQKMCLTPNPGDPEITRPMTDLLEAGKMIGLTFEQTKDGLVSAVTDRPDSGSYEWKNYWDNKGRVVRSDLVNKAVSPFSTSPVYGSKRFSDLYEYAGGKLTRQIQEYERPDGTVIKYREFTQNTQLPPLTPPPLPPHHQ